MLCITSTLVVILLALTRSAGTLLGLASTFWVSLKYLNTEKPRATVTRNNATARTMVEIMNPLFYSPVVIAFISMAYCFKIDTGLRFKHSGQKVPKTVLA